MYNLCRCWLFCIAGSRPKLSFCPLTNCQHCSTLSQTSVSEPLVTYSSPKRLPSFVIVLIKRTDCRSAFILNNLPTISINIHFNSATHKQWTNIPSNIKEFLLLLNKNSKYCKLRFQRINTICALKQWFTTTLAIPTAKDKVTLIFTKKRQL